MCHSKVMPPQPSGWWIFDHLADAVVVFLNKVLKHPSGVPSLELVPTTCWG
jgi:hypothetical protein